MASMYVGMGPPLLLNLLDQSRYPRFRFEPRRRRFRMRPQAALLSLPQSVNAMRWQRLTTLAPARQASP
jgi:hypothetical protein